MIENREAGALLRELFPHTGRALTVGVTGAPGAGKSTLVSRIVRALRQDGATVAVVAVDPSSPFTGGAILGDRVRMMEHHADDGVFIRSMATRGRLGGLAATTGDLVVLLDAAGFDVILVETVGVGQDEVDIVRMAGITLVVLAPGMGDEVQAIKAGIMEIADVYILNKADQPGIDKLEREIQGLGASVPCIRCSPDEGTAEVLRAIRSFVAPPDRGVANWAERLRALYRERLTANLDPADVQSAAERVAARLTDPYTVVDNWIGQEAQCRHGSGS